MNFEHMPELKWPLAYALVIVVTVVSTAGAYLYFKRKRWF
jgi:magnesium transporter